MKKHVGRLIMMQLKIIGRKSRNLTKFDRNELYRLWHQKSSSLRPQLLCWNWRYRHLSNEVSVESEADVSRVTPVDDGDAGPVSRHVQSFDDPLDELQHVVPSLGVHRAGGMEYEREIYQSAASWTTIATATAHSHSHLKERCTHSSEYAVRKYFNLATLRFVLKHSCA